MKKQLAKKGLAYVIMAAMAITSMPAAAFADETSIVEISTEEEKTAEEEKAEEEKTAEEEKAEEETAEEEKAEEEKTAEEKTEIKAELIQNTAIATFAEKSIEVDTEEKLNNAVKDAADGVETTVVLTDNITLDDTLEIPAGKVINLDLGGFKLDITKSENVILNNGTLTISNGSVIGVDNGKDSQGIAIYNKPDATVTINGEYDGSGLILKGRSGLVNEGTAIINGGTSESYNKHSIYTEAGSKTYINGGKVLSETGSSGFGRAINAHGDVTITGGEIYSGGSSGKGDAYMNAISMFSDSTLTIKPADGKTVSVISETDYAIAPAGDSKVLIYGGDFACNGSRKDFKIFENASIEIFGGTFRHEVDSSLLGENCYVEVENDKYVVKKYQDPVSVSVNSYDELVDALNSPITEPKNITVGTNIVVPFGSDIELKKGSTINIPNGITFTVDGILRLNGEIINNGVLDVSETGFIENPIAVTNNGKITDYPEAVNGICEISTPMQLQWLSHIVHWDNENIPENIILKNDITIPDNVLFTQISIEELVPYHDSVFDGNNHKITNINVEAINDYGGLFGTVQNAKVRNLIIENAKIKSTDAYIGALAGLIKHNVTIDNVHILNSSVKSSISYGAGGFAGQIWTKDETARAEFINCSSENVNVEGYANVGGIWGTGTGSLGTVGIYNSKISGTVNAINVNGGICCGYGNSTNVQVIGLDKDNITLTVKETVSDTMVSASSSTDLLDFEYAGKENNAVKDESGNWIAAEDGVTEIAASIGSAKYITLEAALNDAKDGDIVTLEKDVVNEDLESPKNITINSNIVLDGNGHNIEGNVALYVDKLNSDTKITNISFNNIHNKKSDRSPIYASGLSGKLTITNCSFTNCDWDAIQTTPVAGAEIVITDNTFEINSDAAKKGERFVHVQSDENVDFAITVTRNKMIGNTNQSALEVYYPSDLSRVMLSGNYITSDNKLCILDGSGKNISEVAYPMADENLNLIKEETVIAKKGYSTTAYKSLEDAIKAINQQTNKTGYTISLIQDISLNTEVEIPKEVSLDVNGCRIMLETGAKLVVSNDIQDSIDIPSGYKLVVSGSDSAGYTYTVKKKSSGSGTPSYDGGGSTSSDKTETTENSDGSTTTTVTDSNGTVTETTKYEDGSTIVVETTKDGVITTTETDVDGNKTETVEEDDIIIITVKMADGSSSKTIIEEDKATETDVELSKEAAESDIAVLPMPSATAEKESESAHVVNIDVEDNIETKVEVPVENMTEGTVAVKVNEDGTEEVIKNSLMGKEGVVITVEGSATVKIVDRSKEFDDVAEGYWGEDAITFATSRELFAGTSESTFSPESDMTRAMVWTVLARFDGVDTTSGSTWYEAGQKWAVENGISDGTNPDSSISREQLVAMLYRYAGTPEAAGSTADFKDSLAISDYAQKAMIWAYENGIISGMGDGTINPQGKGTRAQVATIMMNFVEYSNK